MPGHKKTDIDRRALLMRPLICTVLTMATIIAWIACSVSAVAEPPPLAKAPYDTRQATKYQQQWAKHTGKPLVHTNSIGLKSGLYGGKYISDAPTDSIAWRTPARL